MKRSVVLCILFATFNVLDENKNENTGLDWFVLFIRLSSSSVSSTYGSWAEEQNLHHHHHLCVWQAGSSGMQMSFFHSLFIRTNKEPLSHEIHLIKIIRHFEHSSPHLTAAIIWKHNNLQTVTIISDDAEMATPMSMVNCF